MKDILLSPPLALLINIGLIGILYGLGRFMAGPSQVTPAKTSTYSSGEEPPTQAVAPGYRPYFVVALFFAVLHLGVLVLGSGGMTVISGIYLVGLALALMALILG
jgi:NADH:ubiquinone oxidoreductase subunit 3 (subunit A)